MNLPLTGLNKTEFEKEGEQWRLSNRVADVMETVPQKQGFFESSILTSPIRGAIKLAKDIGVALDVQEPQQVETLKETPVEVPKETSSEVQVEKPKPFVYDGGSPFKFSVDSIGAKDSFFQKTQGKEVKTPGAQMLPEDFNTIKTKFDPSKAPQPSDFPEGSMERYSLIAAKGFAGGSIPLPGAGEQTIKDANPQGWKELAAYGAGTALSSLPQYIVGGKLFAPLVDTLALGKRAMALPIIGKGISTLQKALPKTFDLLVGKQGLEHLIDDSVKLGLTFTTIGQLTAPANTPILDRVKESIRTIPDSIIFSRLGGVQKPIRTIPLQAGYGYISSKLAGGSEDDAISQSLIFGGLGVWGLLENLPEGQMKQNLIDKSMEVVKSVKVSVTGEAVTGEVKFKKNVPEVKEEPIELPQTPITISKETIESVPVTEEIKPPVVKTTESVNLVIDGESKTIKRELAQTLLDKLTITNEMTPGDEVIQDRIIALQTALETPTKTISTEITGKEVPQQITVDISKPTSVDYNNEPVVLTKTEMDAQTQVASDVTTDAKWVKKAQSVSEFPKEYIEQIRVTPEYLIVKVGGKDIAFETKESIQRKETTQEERIQKREEARIKRDQKTIELPQTIRTRIETANKEVLSGASADKFIEFIKNDRAETFEGFSEYVMREHLGDKATSEEWAKFLLDREIHKTMGESYGLQKVTEEGGNGVEAGFEVTGGRAELSPTYKGTESIYEKDLITPDMVKQFLLQDIKRGQGVSAAGTREVVRSYFENSEAKLVKFTQELNRQLEDTGSLTEIKLPFTIYDTDRQNLLADITGKFLKTQGDIVDFRSALTGEDARLANTPSKSATIHRRSKDVARMFGYDTETEMYDAFRLAYPKEFIEVDKNSLAKQILSDEVIGKINYDRSNERFITEPEITLIKENKKEFVPEDVYLEKMKGRVDIVEELVDGIDSIMRRGKVKGAKGVEFDNIIQMESYRSDTIVHEYIHKLDRALNISGNIPKNLADPIANELQPFVASMPTGSKTLPEAIAEFGKRYIIGEDTRKDFPLMTDYFENYLKQADEGIFSQIQIAKENFTALRNAPEITALASEVYRGNQGETLSNVKKALANPEKTANRIKQGIIDTRRKMIDIFAYAKDIDKTYGLDYHEGVWGKMDTLSQRIQGYLELSTTHGVPDWNTFKEMTYGSTTVEPKFTSEPLNQIIADIPVEKLQFVAPYLIAKETIARREQAKKAGGEYTENEFVAGDKAGQVIEQALAIYPEIESTRKRLLEYRNSLLKFRLDAELITPEMYKTLIDNESAASLLRVGELFEGDFTNYDVIDTVFKKSTGSLRPFKDPVISLFHETHAVMRDALTNHVAQQLHRLASETPSQHIDVLPKQVKPIELSPDEFIARMKKFDPSLTPEEIGGYRKLAELNPNVLSLFRTQHEGSIQVSINGEKAYVKVSPEIKDALGLAHTDSTNSKLIQSMQLVTSYGRAAATTYSARFSFWNNFLRDSMSQWNMADKPILPIYGQYKGLTHIKEKTDTYVRGLAAGMKGNEMIADDINTLARTIEKSGVTKNTNPFKWSLHKLQEVSQYSELATRYGILGNYDVKNPAELRKGILDARYATINWSQRGATDSIVTGWNRVEKFFKPRIIAFDQTVKKMAEHPERIVTRGLPIMATTLFLENLYKDDEDYKKLPFYRHVGFLNIKVGDTFIPIPLPQIWGALESSALKLAYREAQKSDPYLAKQFFSSMVADSTPVDMSSAIPDFVQPMVEQYFNKAMFTGKQIIPDYLLGVEKNLQYGEFSSDAAVGISKAFNGMGMKISPMAIDHYMQSYLLTGWDLAKTVTANVADVTGIKPNEFRQSFTRENVPFFASIIRNEYGPTSAYSYTKLVDTYKRTKSSYDAFSSIAKYDPEAAKNFLVEHKTDIMAYKAMDAQYKGISEMVSAYYLIKKKDGLDPVKKELGQKELSNKIVQQAELVDTILEQYYGM